MVGRVHFERRQVGFAFVIHWLSSIAGLLDGSSLRTAAGLFLRGEPFLHAGSPIKHSATDARPRRPETERIPTIERAHVPPQFSGEFFLRQKF